jgi:hypothetical protein
MSAILLWSVGPARGDGDPASDVLASQSVFLPQDAGLSAKQQAELGALVAAAGRSGYQLRVAVISSKSELGSVTGLWRQPETYARFLGQELSLVYRGPLLVVMPNGYGLYGTGSEQSALTALPPPGGRPALGNAALLAVHRLAAASGHALPTPSATVPSGTGSTGAVDWIVFAIGLGIIAAAWGASVRSQPLRFGRS